MIGYVDENERRRGAECMGAALAMVSAELDDDPNLTARKVLATQPDQTEDGLLCTIDGLVALNRLQVSMLAAALTKCDRLENPPGRVVSRQEVLAKLGQANADLGVGGSSE